MKDNFEVYFNKELEFLFFYKTWKVRRNGFARRQIHFVQ